MALFSYVVMFDDKHSVGQLRAETIEDVVKGYFDNHYSQRRKFMGDAPEIGSEHIVLLERMTGLKNMWLCQAGKQGRWVTAFFSQTVEEVRA